jgi:hypothetical protein
MTGTQKGQRTDDPGRHVRDHDRSGHLGGPKIGKHCEADSAQHAPGTDRRDPDPREQGDAGEDDKRHGFYRIDASCMRGAAARARRAWPRTVTFWIQTSDQ